MCLWKSNSFSADLSFLQGTLEIHVKDVVHLRRGRERPAVTPLWKDYVDDVDLAQCVALTSQHGFSENSLPLESPWVPQQTSKKKLLLLPSTSKTGRITPDQRAHLEVKTKPRNQSQGYMHRCMDMHGLVSFK